MRMSSRGGPAAASPRTARRAAENGAATSPARVAPIALRSGAADLQVHWDRVLFSAKESIYKAWFPLTGRWLGFEEASLSIDPAAGTFAARLHVTAESEFHGRFVHVRYFAVRDAAGVYQGTLEVTQDATKIRALAGERRLLQYDAEPAVA